VTCAVFLDLYTSADAVLVDDEPAQVAVAKRIGRSIFTRRVAAEGSEARDVSGACVRFLGTIAEHAFDALTTPRG
jgi:hypothetical protein